MKVSPLHLRLRLSLRVEGAELQILLQLSLSSPRSWLC
jgi:hypothetical protein